jgi:hypothetical protein
MAKEPAEYQRAYRQRQKEKLIRVEVRAKAATGIPAAVRFAAAAGDEIAMRVYDKTDEGILQKVEGYFFKSAQKATRTKRSSKTQ